MNKKTVRDIDVTGQRVLVRVDFNVPLDKETGAIADDTRIRAARPTIQYLIDQGARVILCSHLGRPQGQVRDDLRLTPVAARLGELLGRPVTKTDDCIGPEVQAAVASLGPGDVLLLENLRFHPGERANDPAFAQELVSRADVFVNDAFGTAHRAHASTEGVTHYLPAVAGFLMEKEIDYLSRATGHPEHPYVALIGGAKISGKIEVLENLMDRVDALLIGGGMANTFLKAQGYEVGESLVEDDKLDVARDMLARAGAKIHLPVDVVIATEFDAGASYKVVGVDGVPPGWRIMDIGPQTVEEFGQVLKSARTVVWNGPLGVFEFEPFAAGTRTVARLLAGLDAVTIICGGESAAAVIQAGLADEMSHISTGGGASLEFLEGKTLPGVAALLDR